MTAISKSDFSKDAHGRIQHKNGFIYYTQGGLDCYCGVYCIVNAINFLKFEESKSIENDIISKEHFKLFHSIRKHIIENDFVYDGIMGIGEFGGEGMFGSSVAAIASKFLITDPSQQYYKEDRRRRKAHFFDDKSVNYLRASTCLVWIEEENDTFTDGHWIVTTPSGLAIDSLRGITGWRLAEEQRKEYFEIEREFINYCGNPDFISGATKVKHVHCVIPVALKNK